MATDVYYKIMPFEWWYLAHYILWYFCDVMIKSFKNFLIIFITFQQLRLQISQIYINGDTSFCKELFKYRVNKSYLINTYGKKGYRQYIVKCTINNSIFLVFHGSDFTALGSKSLLEPCVYCYTGWKVDEYNQALFHKSCHQWQLQWNPWFWLALILKQCCHGSYQWMATCY